MCSSAVLYSLSRESLIMLAFQSLSADTLLQRATKVRKVVVKARNLNFPTHHLCTAKAVAIGVNKNPVAVHLVAVFAIVTGTIKNLGAAAVSQTRGPEMYPDADVGTGHATVVTTHRPAAVVKKEVVSHFPATDRRELQRRV